MLTRKGSVISQLASIIVLLIVGAVVGIITVLPLKIVGILVACTVIVAVFWKYYVYTPVMILVAALADRWTIQTRLGSAHIDMLLSLIAFVIVVLRVRKVTLDMPAILWMCWICSNVLSTLMESPSQTESMKIVFWVATSLGAYIVTTTLVKRGLTLDIILKTIAWCGAVEAVFGTIVFVVHGIGPNHFGVQAANSKSFNPIYGTMTEANLFGSFIMLGTFSNLYWMLKSNNKKYGLGFLLCIVGMVISNTRAVWFSFGIGVIVLTLLVLSTGKRLIVLTGILAPLTLFSILVYHATIANALSSPDVMYRLNSYLVAWQQWHGHYLIGLGTNSFGQRYLDPTQGYKPGYLSGMSFQALYDTGVVGFVIQCVAFIKILRKLTPLSSLDKKVVFTLLLSMILAYEATSGFWFSYSWIMLASAAAFSPASLLEKNLLYRKGTYNNGRLYHRYNPQTN